MSQQIDAAAGAEPTALPTAAARTRVETVMWWLAIVGFPLSLSSPGATVSMALLAIYGAVLLVREGGLADDLRWVHRYLAVCYCMVLGVDLLNGGGLANLTSTAFNYLPLLALAPYAHALRKLNMSAVAIERAVQVTLLLAFALSAVRAGVLGEYRPGGPNLAPIGFGMVVATWVVFMLSRALGRAREATWLFVATALGVVPVLLSGSKIAVGSCLFGCALVTLLRAKEHARWKAALIGVIAVSVPLAVGLYYALYQRLLPFWTEMVAFVGDGSISRGSFGARYELAISGLRAFAQKPFLGYGLDERMDAVRHNTTPGGPDITTLTYLHNDYVTHLVAYGLIGAVFLAAYIVFLRLALRNSEDEGNRCLSIALPGMFALYMLAEVVFNMDPITGLLTILLGAVLATDGQPRRSAKHSDARDVSHIAEGLASRT